MIKVPCRINKMPYGTLSLSKRKGRMLMNPFSFQAWFKIMVFILIVTIIIFLSVIFYDFYFKPKFLSQPINIVLENNDDFNSHFDEEEKIYLADFVDYECEPDTIVTKKAVYNTDKNKTYL